ncbi:Choline monooxygenase [Didymella heteroderae]|uniref:Choline monooxygenase n=1 Tax=Didymella heteroderae TaxID=1769908 RepID=A0A9P5BWZ8_9PLEO|nr:Choline monooxygenase [Didymella heteroderae]
MGSTNWRSSTPPRSTANHENSSESALPASWYSYPEMYEFERRAIFSKRWLFITHRSRFTQGGDWLRYSFASYDIIIIRDRTGTISTFHNVCRHRAYPVIEKEGAGNNRILACRYHGWSYGLNGKLAKAPGYQQMNLDKDQSSLFRCHTKIDRNGFIWNNLCARHTPEVVFEEHCGNVEDKRAHIDFEDYTFDMELKNEELNVNWKSESAGFPPERIKTHFDATIAYYFPNASSTISSKFIAIQKNLPQAPNKTIKHFELYRQKDCSDEDWKTIKDAYVGAVEAEKTTETTHFPFQTAVRDAVTEHYKQEKAAGKEIWPSRPVAVGVADQADEDEEICVGLTCGSQKEILAW